MRGLATPLLLTALLATAAHAQNDRVTLSGNLQSDIMLAPQQDKSIGTSQYDNTTALTNTYLDLLMQSRWVDAGIRAEYTQHPMPGFAGSPNEDFKGWGLPHFWAKFKSSHVEVTAGTCYEQFGSGFILRTYEERSQGIDNALLGGRVTMQWDGITLKALSGVQRNYWRWNSGLVSGADMELNLDHWIRPMADAGTHLMLGASWVNKYEADEGELSMIHDGTLYDVTSPKFVNAFDVRARLQKGAWSLLAEYAQKSADPNTKNYAIFRRGYAAMLSASYSQRGFSALFQAKRADNMDFRSRRADRHSNTSYLNHMPAFTLDHTYALAALYPYATQADGEWAYQGSLAYTFRRKTALGGRYGTKVKLNYSLVEGIARNSHEATPQDATTGYGSAFWKWGECYYQDLNVQLEKRVTRDFDMHLMYMYQQYNRMVEGHAGNIYSHIFIGEGKWKLSKRNTLRAEAQYLHTRHESDDWMFGLVELSVAPHLMFTVSDQIGRPEVDGAYGSKTHYYTLAVTGNYGSHRLQVSYGRTRAGMNCTGGVCRYIPASKGFTLNYNYNF